MTIDPHKTKERAYQLWQEQGQPDGQDKEHWAQAEREQELETPTTVPAEKATSRKQKNNK